jgi:phosphoglycolate phosphatase
MEPNNHIVVSFDLDFTLIDNKEGILNSFKHAFTSFKLKPIEESLLEQTIGEPLHEVFSRFTDEDPHKLIASFRNFYRKKGIYQVRLYEGVVDVLNKLKKAGMKLGVVTSKKRELAIKLLKYLEIFHLFDFVCGETDIIKNKTDPRLKQFFHSRFPPQKNNYIVVGDHLSDKDFAKMLKCPFIGVLTGQQSESTLRNRNCSCIEIIPHISQLQLSLIKRIITNKIKKGKD